MHTHTLTPHHHSVPNKHLIGLLDIRDQSSSGIMFLRSRFRAWGSRSSSCGRNLKMPVWQRVKGRSLGRAQGWCHSSLHKHYQLHPKNVIFALIISGLEDWVVFKTWWLGGSGKERRPFCDHLHPPHTPGAENQHNFRHHEKTDLLVKQPRLWLPEQSDHRGF